ncbi:hypothetical protein [Ferrimicrobium acidiphilum]|jgi:hypothetical protein|uniref:hypothetical protein n=1 Tax=Ferrimicrobium acidiphilum TaxID=121039 RepID=UPI0023F56609|nr:hypothetical protein [Ferrimicrobium acidiphilum]
MDSNTLGYIYDTPLWRIGKLANGEYVGESILFSNEHGHMVNADIDLVRAATTREVVRLVLDELIRLEDNPSSTKLFTIMELDDEHSYCQSDLLGLDSEVPKGEDEARNWLISSVRSYLLRQLSKVVAETR